MATKMKIIFDGFADLAYAIDKAGGDLKEAVDEALVATQSQIQQNVSSAAAPYAAKGRKGYATGRMYDTIIADGAVHWEGSIAYVDTGFRIRESGGWHSIFVMYGTPRMAKDTAVYNAIKGTATQKQIAKLQQEIMQKHLELGE
jgi:hypothetical protein